MHGAMLEIIDRIPTNEELSVGTWSLSNTCVFDGIRASREVRSSFMRDSFVRFGHLAARYFIATLGKLDDSVVGQGEDEPLRFSRRIDGEPVFIEPYVNATPPESPLDDTPPTWIHNPEWSRAKYEVALDVGFPGGFKLYCWEGEDSGVVWPKMAFCAEDWRKLASQCRFGVIKRQSNTS